MAADPQPDWLSCLPPSWTYGVTRDGRIFFISEEAKSTTWLHPLTGEAVLTGHSRSSDLPTGWEEGFTYEGARCFINHNERKVTCKHPVSGVPSQDNCIFVVNEHVSCGKFVHPDRDAVSRPALKSPSEPASNNKDRPLSTMSEASNYTGGSNYTTASNYTGGSNYSTFPCSPATTTSSSSTRPSRPSKKVHNFGKRSNSIKRNLKAPVVKSSWLYKQDSTGMKLWKKRWFVLSDMCLFYYRDEKEDSILGSILLPSFHVSMLSVDDHISRKYAFKATHPNMRTYYFCTDTAKEMESWMKVMTDAALVHTEPVRRTDKLKVDQRTPQELNNLLNHRVLTPPEIHNNERNREPARQHSLSRADDSRQLKNEERLNMQREYYTLQRDGERYSVKKDGVSYMLQKDGEKFLLHKDGEKFLLRKDGEKYSLQKEGDMNTIHRDLEKYAVHKVDNKYAVTLTDEKYAPSKDGEKYLLAKDGEKYALQKVGDRHTLKKDGHKHVPQKEVRRQLSLKETERFSSLKEGSSRYGTIQVVDRYGALKEVRKYATLREGDRYASLTDTEKFATVRVPSLDRKPSTDRNRNQERSLTKISSIKLQPAQAAAIAAAVSASRQNQAGIAVQRPVQMNSTCSGPVDQHRDCSQTKVEENQPKAPVQEQDGGLSRTDSSLSRTASIQQLEQWTRVHLNRGLDEDTRSITSYQTLPRNMPSHRAPITPRYPEGYRTLPRNSMMRPDSICCVAGSVYDRALHPASTGNAEKRRSMRDDTMWQLYEWQQRQAFSRQSLAPPTAVGHYGTLPSTRTMGSLSEHAVAPSIPTSPSHGSLAMFSTFSPPRQQVTPNPGSSQSEVSSPVLKGDATLDRRHRTHLAKYGYPTDRRSMAANIPPQTITPQTLQGKTPEELTLLLIKLRRQQAELNSLREHTVAQLMALGLEGPNAKTDVLSHHLQRNLIYLDSQTKENEPLIFMIHTMIENSAPRPQLYHQVSPDDLTDGAVKQTDQVDIDTQLSHLCEQDQAVRLQEEKLQQLLREKHTLETALLSASQELSEQSGDAAVNQSLIQQRDVLQSGLLSTCRELSRVSTELQRSWTEYERLEADVTQAKTNLLEQLEALGSPQTEPPSQRHIQIQKELWRIQDVMEALSKTRPQRNSESGVPGSKALSSQNNEGVTPLALSPSTDTSNGVPPRPPLPQYYNSSNPSSHGPSPQTHRPEERKTSCRNGAHNQAPDYRMYKSEPELTTVKEEVDEANVEDKDKTEASVESKVPTTAKATPYPVGIVPPRTKSPISPPESSTIASYVTLRKTKRPESRLDRPRSAVEQVGLVEREVGRMRMSVEEQLERMRRNQEALLLREKKRETPSRSQSFSRDNPPPVSQRCVQPGGACPDPVELEAALQQLKAEQSRTTSREHDRTLTCPQETQRSEEVKNTYNQQEEDEMQRETNCTDEMCESQMVVILDLGSQQQQVQIIDFQPFDGEQDVTSSPTNPPTDSSFQTLSPEPMEETDGDRQTSGDQLDQNLDSGLYSQKHTNMLPSQTFTLVTSDT